MTAIDNPILRGFHPDPSILRVEDDYYIATSTFEWFPGVRIHHSRDLVHWRPFAHPLADTRLLRMEGNPSSGGIWAPCLTYDNGIYYLVFTDVKSCAGVFKDTPNYLVTASRMEGLWSNPVYLNSSGFDPSFFHDDDGRKWLLNMVWDHRKGRNPFHGIVIQEYSISEQKLVGEARLIFQGTALGCTEGPHVYKRNGYYYLMTAEGGTGYEHAVTMARSKSLFGPYEADPANPILTSNGHPELALQKAGHGSLVETRTGEWYLAHLCARPLPGLNRSPLGRETALQRVRWTDDGWLRLEAPGRLPLDRPLAPRLAPHPFEQPPERDDFDGCELGMSWCTLRVPADGSWLSLSERPGFLRLYGRESLQSAHRQSLVARRLDSLEARIETSVEFEPESFQQMAGLIFYYNHKHYYYLNVTWDERLGKCLTLITCDNGVYDEALDAPIPLRRGVRCVLRASVHQDRLQFYGSAEGEPERPVGSPLDLSKLSDEYCTKTADGLFTDWGFTGAFVGMCVQDLSGRRKIADFDYFLYAALNSLRSFEGLTL